MLAVAAGWLLWLLWLLRLKWRQLATGLGLGNRYATRASSSTGLWDIPQLFRHDNDLDQSKHLVVHIIYTHCSLQSLLCYLYINRSLFHLTWSTIDKPPLPHFRYHHHLSCPRSTRIDLNDHVQIPLINTSQSISSPVLPLDTLSHLRTSPTPLPKIWLSQCSPQCRRRRTPTSWILILIWTWTIRVQRLTKSTNLKYDCSPCRTPHILT